MNIPSTLKSVTVTGGNILCDLTGTVQPVNQFGVPLFEKVLDTRENYYSRIETAEGMYQYLAEASELIDGIHIYVPKFCIETTIDVTQ